MDALSRALQDLEPITLGEMDSIRLMNRIDSKYVTTLDRLLEFLLAARGHYRVLDTDGRLNAYDTIYYDTPGREMYVAHHNRHLTRKKVRVRTYVGSGTTFLEVKLKNNHGRTKKKRIECDRSDPFGTPGAPEFLEKLTGYSPADLHRATRTAFERITLVNAARTERLTIDTSLHFENFETGISKDLGCAVIIELKQDGRAASLTKDLLLGLRIHPLKVSKYCIGTAITDPAIKRGNFKEKIHALEKMTNKTLL